MTGEVAAPAAPAKDEEESVAYLESENLKLHKEKRELQQRVRDLQDELEAASALSDVAGQPLFSQSVQPVAAPTAVAGAAGVVPHDDPPASAQLGHLFSPPAEASAATAGQDPENAVAAPVSSKKRTRMDGGSARKPLGALANGDGPRSSKRRADDVVEEDDGVSECQTQ